jgi:hypothetical protein
MFSHVDVAIDFKVSLALKSEKINLSFVIFFSDGIKPDFLLALVTVIQPSSSGSCNFYFSIVFFYSK